MLPTNVLQSLHVHAELALKERTHCRDEPSQLDMQSSSPHAFPSAAIQGLTTSPRVMWKEPDSVFSNSEEVKSVFRALGMKSARMSILERMRWVTEDKHNADFQQYPLTTPAPEGPRPAFCLLSCPGGAHPLPSLEARVKVWRAPLPQRLCGAIPQCWKSLPGAPRSQRWGNTCAASAERQEVPEPRP